MDEKENVVIDGNEEIEPAEPEVESDDSDEDLSEESVSGDAAGSNADENNDEPEAVDKKRGFKKKSKPDKQKERIHELEDRVMRQMAEFENYRKRTEKEKSHMFEIGARSVIEKILPVVDNFERGLDTMPDSEKSSSFAEGMNMIYKQLLTELDNLDIKVIPAVGEEFNPELHNAVMQVESDEYESGFIAQEMQKGYTYRNSVVRYSMVAVVQ